MNLFQAAHDLFVEHFGAEFFRRPARAMDLRGFRMTRREAARWLDAIDPPGWDEPMSRADFAKVASRAELFLWSRANRGADPRSRALSAIYLAAARGPDFWRPKMCVMECGRPATWVAAWIGDTTPCYCDECTWRGDENVEWKHAPRLRALWRMAHAKETT